MTPNTTSLSVQSHLDLQSYIRHLQQSGHSNIAEHIYDGILTIDEAQRILNGEQIWQRLAQLTAQQQIDKYGLYRGA